MFEDDSLFAQCLEQPLNTIWEKAGSDLTLVFDRTPYAKDENRPFLILEGVPAAADLFLNGQPLGRLQPYLPYRFEVTRLLQPEKNSLVLRFPPDGPIRPPQNAYIDFKKQNVILNAGFSAVLQPGGRADCTVDIRADLADMGLNVQLFLMDPMGNIVHDANFPAQARACHAFSLASPMLWSPDSPQLYSLNISLEKNGLLFDMYSHGKSGKVGFKHVDKSESAFLLNGIPFTPKAAHLPSDISQVDLSGLKESGVNLVFCAHPPLALLEAADETGILVSALPPPSDAFVLPIFNHVSLLL